MQPGSSRSEPRASTSIALRNRSRPSGFTRTFTHIASMRSSNLTATETCRGSLLGYRAVPESSLRDRRGRGQPQMPSNSGGAAALDILAAHHESGADRDQQNAARKDEDQARMVVIEQKAEERRRHRRTEVETRIDETDHCADRPGRSRAAHQQIARRRRAAPGETPDRDAQKECWNRQYQKP